MSRERPSKNNRIAKTTRSLKGKLSSLLHFSHPPTPSSINADSCPDNHTATTDAGTSNVSFHYPPSSQVPLVSIDCAPDTTVANTDPMSPPISIAGNPVPEAPSTISFQNANSPFSALHSVENVYMHHPTIINANNVNITLAL
ncbi:hypothetical protein BYT27DRAFT_6846053 [Phlegmacium glaucopus]|nr:hypothetical protein BYT27DRAFT_6846053 [Phlegmacium glaucopus]